MFDERKAAALAADDLKNRGVETRLRAPDWERTTRKPRLQLPPGACDSHLHIIGPQAIFPLLAGPFNFLDFEDSTVDDWMRVKNALGFSRGLHVQSFMYGHGYHMMLHTLKKAAGALRGVVGLWPGITDGELDLLGAAGVVGARFTHSLHPSIDENLIGRLAERGWSIHYSLDSNADENWRSNMVRRPGRFVLEHIGMVPPASGIDGPEFKFVLKCLDTGRCWVKLSARPSDDLRPPFADLLAPVLSVLERAPDRALWGSDWPHVP
jgi:predicted TIM-barrel fold metal-dependent hydrolase